MKLTKPIINAFWELLRCGLWNSMPEASSFRGLTSGEWEHIYGLVKKHAVIGITFPVLEMLPVELKPHRNIYLNWCGMVLQIKNQNQKMNEVYHNLSCWFEQSGIYPILMKGMGVATWYPQPLLRMAGDIDIYIRKQDYVAAIDMIKRARIPLKETPEHDEFVFQGVEVELHTYTSHYGSILEDMQHCELTSNGNSKYRIPSTEANALLLIKHPAKHIFTSGSAIRHLCDWAIFLQKNHNRISFDSLEEKLRSEGFDRFAMILTSLAVEYLGLSQAAACQNWLDKSGKRQKEILLNDLMEKGDCGIRDWNQRLLIGQLPFSWTGCSKWITYYGKTYFRLMKLSALFPEIIQNILIGRVKHRLKMVAIGKPFVSC